jgi:succinate dehydrogenase/fumarate reductase flavoprotein subunit
MLKFFERETTVKFLPTIYPDYHPNVAGGVDIGRSVIAAPYDARNLGSELGCLRPPLRTITFNGMMFNSANNELKHFFNATKSMTSAIYVGKRLSKHLTEVALYRRGVQATSGNALIARLAKSALDLGVPIRTNTPARQLWTDDGKVKGALVSGSDGDDHIGARRGVVLSCGGFPHDIERPHVARGAEHVSPTPSGNIGDGIRMAEEVGARIEERYPNAAAWMPVSQVPLGKGRTGVFPHLVDRYKPGVIAVNRHGRRFTNESESYHDIGAAMIRECEGERETTAWLICDHPTIRKYGLGFAKPAPVPLQLYTRTGYLKKGRTLRELARVAGIEPGGLEETVRKFNVGAERGEDSEFGRGSTAFNRYLGDSDHKPNPKDAVPRALPTAA